MLDCVHVHPNTSVRLLMRPFDPRGLLILFLVIDLAMKLIFQSKSPIVQREKKKMYRIIVIRS